MRILFVIDSLQAGGKERRLTELIKHLVNYKIEFEIAVFSQHIHYEEIIALRIPVHYLLRESRHDLTVISKLYSLCKSFKPDIIHCWDSMSAVFAIPSCMLLGIKLVNGMIVDAPSNNHIFNKYYLRARFSFLFSKIIIGNSLAGIRAYKAPVRKSKVIHNGFNFDRVSELQDRNITREKLGVSTPFVIGMVASNSRFKDYDTYFEAAEKILNTRIDVTFLAIGSGTDDSDFKTQLSDKVQNTSRLLGKRSDIEQLVNVMDICVLSTYTEGISNAIMEYMALGKPVIATDGGGTNEIIEEGITGFLVPQKSPHALAERITTLLENESQRIQMGKAGQEKIRKEFSIESMVTHFIKVYESIKH